MDMPESALASAFASAACSASFFEARFVATAASDALGSSCVPALAAFELLPTTAGASAAIAAAATSSEQAGITNFDTMCFS
jgi:hypothetical protein